MYRKYGMLTASFWDIWGPKTWWVYLKEISKGAKLRRSEGDISQRGGDVLIDPSGIVSLHHIGAGPADRPPIERLLQRIDLIVDFVKMEGVDSVKDRTQIHGIAERSRPELRQR